MEPENGSIEQSEPLKKRIAAADVLAFVRQHGVELRLRPFAGALRQNDSGVQQAHCDGNDTGSARQPARADGADGEAEQKHTEHQVDKSRCIPRPLRAGLGTGLDTGLAGSRRYEPRR